MTLKPHSLEWYQRLAKLQRGYYYPWKSILPPFNGEDVYLEMLYSLLQPDDVVLDAGCGHGELTLRLAPHCKEIVAYDRITEYIDLAYQAAQARGIGNAAFILGNSSQEFNGGKVRIPTDRNDFTLLISRRGPLNWIEDIRRVANPGAVVFELNPDLAPPPPWNDRLPAMLRQPEPDPNWPMRASVERELAAGGLNLHSCWHFDVPETFSEPEQLYIRLTWGSPRKRFRATQNSSHFWKKSGGIMPAPKGSRCATSVFYGKRSSISLLAGAGFSGRIADFANEAARRATFISPFNLEFPPFFRVIICGILFVTHCRLHL